MMIKFLLQLCFKFSLCRQTSNRNDDSKTYTYKFDSLSISIIKLYIENQFIVLFTKHSIFKLFSILAFE